MKIGPRSRGLVSVPAGTSSVPRAGRNSLSGARPCPHLACTDGRPLPYDYASRRHVCKGQSRQEWRGLHRVTIDFTRVTREHQAEYCLTNFAACEVFQAAARQAAEPGAAETASGPAMIGAGRGRRPKSRRPRRKSLKVRTPQQETMILLGKVGAFSVLFAFVVSLFFSGGARRFYQNLALSFIKSNAASFGVSAEQLKKAEKAGLLDAENLGQLQKLRRAGGAGIDKDKIKSSSAFKSLSEAQKARLKKQFGGR